MLTKSKRTPIKHSGALRAICNAHSVTVEDSNLMVCQGRKVVYVLRIGEIHSFNCFVNEPPTPSYRKESGLAESGWRSIVVPNGWKVALIVDNEVWTAEVSYDHNDRDLAQYKFALIGEDGEALRESDWCYTPSGAFKSASSTPESEDQAWGRHNGKLYLGCTYDYPQTFIRNHFSKILASREGLKWSEEIKKAMRDWLDPAKQTDLPVALSRVASSSSLPETRSALRATRAARAESVSAAPTSTKQPLVASDLPKIKRKWEDSTTPVLPPLSDALPVKRSCSMDSSFSALNTLLQASLGADGPSSAATAFSSGGIEAQSKRLDLANALFSSQIWSEVKIEDVEIVSSASLRTLMPSSPRRPDIMSHVRAMTSKAENWLNETEIFALLQHVDIQVRKTASQKLAGAGTACFAGGFFLFDAVKRVLLLVKSMQGKPSNPLDEFMVNQVRMDHFVACLELLESCAEQVYPVVVQTLFLLPLEDIFQQIISTKQAQGEFRQGLLFVQQRMAELGWTTFEQLQSAGLESSNDFVRVMTFFLPRSSFIRKFTRCLYSVSTDSPLGAASSSQNVQHWNSSALMSSGGAPSSTSVLATAQELSPAPSPSLDTVVSIAGFLSSLPTTWGRSASTPATSSLASRRAEVGNSYMSGFSSSSTAWSFTPSLSTSPFASDFSSALSSLAGVAAGGIQTPRERSSERSMAPNRGVSTGLKTATF